jgi:DNA-3-methyladenine glycosylase II
LVARRVPALAPVVRASGPPPAFRPAPVAARFADLATSVTHQLLATAVARTIHARVLDACGGELTPESVRASGSGALRAAGLSGAKAQTLLDLADAVTTGELDLAHHGRRRDDEVEREVTAVRGIGPWTAHMYLMFTLGRPDVWPVGDFGVRHGWSLVHGLDETIASRDLAPLGDALRGHRSTLAWYCWRAVDLARAK